MLSAPAKQENEDFTSNSVTESSLDFPTLIPHNSVNNPLEELELATASSPKIRTEEGVEMNDMVPTIMDKNRQVILSRTEPNWQSLVTGKQIQTYGRDRNGKLIPLFGIESAAVLPQTPIEPYPPREIRYAYRTSNRQPVVYVPAVASLQPSETIPANPPQRPIELHILPPIPEPPAPQPQIIYQTTPAPIPFTYSTFAPSGQDNFPSNDVQCNGQCGGGGRPESDDDKCNSQRYIAHTDEFCLASSGGVNCYVFSPVCQEKNMMATRKKAVLSRN
ncbi:unnamed protein product [Caenorhabditis sp. 36 PRJEB53466]|nr:unnamed protein product [Caenorhabditis sp. 36 PRJEB53466]